MTRASLLAALSLVGLAAGCESAVVEMDAQEREAESCGLSPSPLALSTAQDCMAPGVAGATGDSPCDPGCRVFQEIPSGGLQANDVFSWSTGRPSDLSASIYAQGFGTCETGADCQFNSACDAPALGTCSHSVCEAGAGLRDGCSDCATIVCADDPSCCESETATTCDHDPCQVGTPLGASCDSCVTSICSSVATAHCCSPSGTWDQTCVDAVATTCGATCGCGSGEEEIAGRCYAPSQVSRTWDRAVLDCRRRGVGWDLTSLEDAGEDAAVGALGSGYRWIGLFDAGSGASGPAGALTAFVSSEKPGNDPGFAFDGNSSTSWSAESGLAANVSITASESQTGHPAVDAIDGNNTSYWGAESVDPTDGKVLLIELETAVSLEEVTMRWKKAHERQFDFEIFAGPDVASLTEVYARTWSTMLSAAGSETYDVVDTMAQVIEITTYGNSVSGWNSIEEISFGSSPATVFSFTRLPQSITFEMPGSSLVEDVSLEWTDANTDFEVWVGESLSGLSLAYSGTNGATTTLVTYDVVDTQGRYVQVRGFGNSSSRWNNLEEAAIGTASSAAGTWIWSSGDPAGYANWASGNPGTDDCGAMRDNGTWASRSCSESYPYVCEGPPGHMGASPGDYTATCAARAEELCHVRCDASDPSRADGACLAWAPGATDPSCLDVDLAVGVPCDGVIPVCNHGTVDAPAGIDVAHFDQGAQLFGAASADVSHASAVVCTTTEAIPAGECIALTGCVPGGSGLREVMVNPQGASPECSTVDNWAVYDESITCDVPYCGGSTTSSEKPMVDIIIFVDNSSSMEDEIDAIEASLSTDFAQIIEASGLDYRVIMLSRFARNGESVVGTYFPICIGPPLGNAACTNSAVPFELTPPFYPFSNDSESEDAWCDVLASFSQADEYAPLDEARPWPTLSPQGWSQWLREDAFKSFLVFTDDEVKCSWGGHTWIDQNSAAVGTTIAAQFDAEILALSPEHFGTSASRKYVWHSIIGMVGNSSSGSVAPWQPSDTIKTTKCGSGSDAPGTGHQALSRLTGGLRYPICNTSDFGDIFQEVAEAVVDTSLTPCVYAVPSGGGIDATTSNVTVRTADASSGAETVLDLSRVADLGSCASNSYFFDNLVAPTELTLCPSTCTAVQATVGQEVQVLVEMGCGVGAPATFTETYQAECGRGRYPIWTMVTYDSTVTGDGTIEFAVRAGTDALDLASKTFAAAGTVTAGNPVCGLGCAAQIDAPLTSTDWSDQFLELQIVITPSSSGVSPRLNDWEVRYSCQDGE